MTIEQAKKDLLTTLDSMDKNKLSLPDLSIYAQILKTVSEIQSKSYVEMMAEAFSSNKGLGFNSPKVSDLK